METSPLPTAELAATPYKPYNPIVRTSVTILNGTYNQVLLHIEAREDTEMKFCLGFQSREIKNITIWRNFVQPLSDKKCFMITRINNTNIVYVKV